MRILPSRRILIAICWLASVRCAWADDAAGEAIYREQCARCHGTAGEGTDEYSASLTGDHSVAQLAALIAETMPADTDEKCPPADAEKVAAYIYNAFDTRFDNLAIGCLLAAATQPAATAYVADTTDARDRTRGMALIGVAAGVGTIMGPIVGGTLSTISAVFPLYVAAALAAAVAIVAALGLREPARHAAAAGTRAGIGLAVPIHLAMALADRLRQAGGPVATAAPGAAGRVRRLLNRGP